jgi:hypothetical protein
VFVAGSLAGRLNAIVGHSKGRQVRGQQEPARLLPPVAESACTRSASQASRLEIEYQILLVALQMA